MLENILQEFRQWWEQEGELTDSEPAEAPQRAAEPIDLHTLLAQFVAMRHEVKLQTKATRAQQEQNDAALEMLASALDELKNRQTAFEEHAEAAAIQLTRPLLMSFIELYDALALAQKEVARMDQTLLPALEALNQQDEAAATATNESFWSKWFGGKTVNSPPTPEHKMAADRAAKLVTAVATGYDMSLKRIERTLQDHELEIIHAVGEPFDPERMEIADVVIDPGRANTEVIEEVRRGYIQKDRVFRFAQVRVAKPAPGGNT